MRKINTRYGVTSTMHSDLYRLGVTLLTLVKRTTLKANQGSPAVERSYNVYCGPVGGGG